MDTFGLWPDASLQKTPAKHELELVHLTSLLSIQGSSENIEQ